MSCQHAELIGETSVVCAEIVKRVGLRCGMSAKACEDCKYISGDTSVVDQASKSHLRNLLISGNQPRFADTVDVPALAARFIPISTKEEREDVVAKAIECQCIPEEKGGCDAEALDRNLQELERELDVSAVLERLL